MARGKKTENETAREPELSVEETFQKIEEKIQKLSDESISLEEAFQNYEEGIALLKSCNHAIDKVEKSVALLREDGETEEFQ